VNTQRIIQWLSIVATAGLLILLKKLHIGVTHYNLFLLILIGWCLGIIFLFRLIIPLGRSQETD